MRLPDKYREWKTRLAGGKVYTGHYSDRPELEVQPHHQRRGVEEGATPVWVNGRQLDKLLYLSVDGEVFTRAERLAMMVETTSDIEVEGMQFWLSLRASVYQRNSEVGNAELALNILADAVGEAAARSNYEDFSAEMVSRLPNDWMLTEAEIRRWVFERNA